MEQLKLQKKLQNLLEGQQSWLGRLITALRAGLVDTGTVVVVQTSSQVCSSYETKSTELLLPLGIVCVCMC